MSHERAADPAAQDRRVARHCARTMSATPERSTATLLAASRGPRRADSVRGCHGVKCERDGELVGAGGLRAVLVIAGAQVSPQSVIDDRAQLLKCMEHLPGCVARFATQRHAGAVARAGGLRRRLVGMRRQGERDAHWGGIAGGAYALVSPCRPRGSIGRHAVVSSRASACAYSASRLRRTGRGL
jgi:hypothetical protein